MSQNERYYGVIYGHQINPKHLNKIFKKIDYYIKGMSDEEILSKCCEVWIEIIDLDPLSMLQNYSVVLPIKKSHFLRFMEIMQRLTWDFRLCHFKHGHPGVTINEISYEGMCFETIDGASLIFFTDERDDKSFVVTKRLKYLPKNMCWLDISPSIEFEKIEQAFAEWLKRVLDYDMTEICQHKRLDPSQFEVKCKRIEDTRINIE